MRDSLNFAQKPDTNMPHVYVCGSFDHDLLLEEQSRPDRDTYISVLWNNIKPGMEDQFTKNSKADISRPYDIMSIMHYGSLAALQPSRFKSLTKVCISMKTMWV